MLHPIKQGLKPDNNEQPRCPQAVAMLHPIKQGLKLPPEWTKDQEENCCYATSNKTRIETHADGQLHICALRLLCYIQ